MKKALISVSNKTGIVELSKVIVSQGYQIIASSGTHEFLKQNNVKSTLISDYTGVPETEDGRVKTLHPKIYQNILNSYDNNDETIDIVVVNLYDFKTKQSVENIDIGGVCLLRAAAKNHERKIVLSDPAQYNIYISGKYKRQAFAQSAFEYTYNYDYMISRWLEEKH